MRRRVLYSKNGSDEGIVDGSKAKTCDVVFANKNTENLIIVSDWSLSDFPSSEWEPIGVVVIPGEHGVLKDEDGNNQCGVMSIVEMDCDNPKHGGDGYILDYFMYFGVSNPDIPGLPKFNNIVTCTDSVIGNLSANGKYTYGYIPSQFDDAIPSWDGSPSSPSPYAGDDMKSGIFNSAYSDTVVGTSDNCLSDFDGPGNTKKIIKERGYIDYDGWNAGWKPTYNYPAHYPAASCCDMFCPTGTKYGDWYLPSIGELGYIMPKQYDISNTITAIKNTYGIGIELDTAYYYWSSTANNEGIWILGAFDGWVRKSQGNLDYHTRAFMRL